MAGRIRAAEPHEIGVFISGNLALVAAAPCRLRGSGLRVRASPGRGWREAGGAYRDRTDDLKLAKLALSQLS